ncbi:MAG: ABC transporter permease [Pirellulales bacterium]|nr:ABC transporter permease [Pirellulales bacterium]
MFVYLIRRILIALLTLVVVSFLGYCLIRFIPGSPVNAEIETSFKKISQADLERMRKQYGLDKPIVVGYGDWLGKIIFERNLGDSFTEKKPVSQVIGSAIGPTLLLTGISLALGYILSIPLGLYCAAAAGTTAERTTSISLYMLYSLPAFVTAILLQSLFGERLQGTWLELPYKGMVSDNFAQLSFPEQILDYARHLILPVFCYTYGILAYDARFIRANMNEVIRQDYIRTARAKGVGEWAILFNHAFRNTLIPFVTLIGLSLPALLSGSVILEQIFNWPGMGKLLYNAFTSRDYPLIMGLVLVYSIMTLLGQLLADLLYSYFDPRIKLQ